MSRFEEAVPLIWWGAQWTWRRRTSSWQWPGRAVGPRFIQAYNFDARKGQLFRAQALPCGASAAVYDPNRFSRAIARTGVRLFSFLWTNFFDDYPHLDVGVLASRTQSAAERFLDLMGCRCSQHLVWRWT